ncbi:MAG: NAD(P)/FAD-dependent oxidoreductase [Chloroflexota bacterium]
MDRFTYLIIGGGMTAAAAAKGIREVDEEGSIAIVSGENRPPYDRPPLTKALWTGKASEEEIWRDVPEDVTFHEGRSIVALDAQARTATADNGETYEYGKLLLATGGTPRRLPFGEDKIIYYRDFNSYRRLRELTKNYDRFAVIGGGFIGSELAAALAMNDKEVTMLFPESGIGARLFPEELAHYLNEYYARQGVEVLKGESVVDVQGEGTELTVVTDQGRRIEADGVVAGIGITPNVALAEKAALKVENGVLVDPSLRTNDDNIYAAGDVANFYDYALQSHRRVEHEDAANSMGRQAGRNMAGAGEDYDYSPMFYSDLFDHGYEAVGVLDSRLKTVADWREENEKGVIYYVDDERLRGVLLWNVWDKVDEARELIAASNAVGSEPLQPEALRGRL